MDMQASPDPLTRTVMADTAPADTGPADAGPADAGPADPVPVDTALADTALVDAALADTGPADTAPVDTGPNDPPGGGEPRIAELRAAMRSLAQAADGRHRRPDIAALEERLVNLENRVTEHDRTLRHTLTMLIEWIECDDAHAAA